MNEKILRVVQRVFFPLELIALVLIFLRFFLKEENAILTGTGFVLLGILYFFSAYFSASPGLSGLAMFSKRILGVSLSVTVIGIYFALLHFPGAKAMLTIGITAVVVSLILILVEILRKSETANLVKFSVIRGLVISILAALILYFTDFNA